MPLPKFEDWKAPWEKQGEDFDPDKGRKFLYSLLQREESALSAKDAADQARADLQAKLDEQTAAGGPQIAALQAQVTELTTKLDQATTTAATEAEKSKLRYEVGLQLGLTPRQLAKLDGDTKEALLEDAQETFGVSGTKEEKEEQTPAPRSRPRTTLRNPGDPDPADKPFDPAKVAEEHFPR